MFFKLGSNIHGIRVEPRDIANGIHKIADTVITCKISELPDVHIVSEFDALSLSKSSSSSFDSVQHSLFELAHMGLFTITAFGRVTK